MSMEDFVKTLSDEQKEALLKALNPTPTDDIEPTQQEIKPKQNQSFITQTKEVKYSQNQKRREPVQARQNEWVDTGEFRDIVTPDVQRTQRRQPQQYKKNIECHVCGKSFKADTRFIFGEYIRCDRCAGRKR